MWCFFHPPPLPADRIHTFFPLLYRPLFQTTAAFSFMVPTPSLFAGILFFFTPVLFQCLVIVLDDNFFLLLCHLLLKDAGCIILFLTVLVVHTSPPSATLHLSTRLPWNLRYREPIRSRVTLLQEFNLLPHMCLSSGGRGGSNSMVPFLDTITSEVI